MKRYFVNDPGSEGFVTFTTKEEQKAYAVECIDRYKGNEWDEDVEDIVCGVITHIIQAVNVVKIPELDADGYDKDGKVWGVGRAGAEMCDYEMIEIKKDICI